MMSLCRREDRIRDFRQQPEASAPTLQSLVLHLRASVCFLLHGATSGGFPGSASVKEPANAGDIRDVGSIPG